MLLTLNMSSNRLIPHVAQGELLAAHCAVSTIWIIWNGPNPTRNRGYVRVCPVEVEGALPRQRN